MYVDANYWIYWFDERLPEHKHVLSTMRESIREGILMNVVTLIEVAHYFGHLPREDFLDRMTAIQNLDTLTLVNLDEEISRLAFEQLTEYAKIGIGGRDSVILATMKATAVKRIATHDSVFKRVKSLKVIDPIP